MIQCNMCKIHKDESEFYHRKDGSLSSSRCKLCRCDQAKLAYAKDGLKKLREWRLANPEVYKEQSRRNHIAEQKRRAEDPAYHSYTKEQKRLNSKKNYVANMVGRAKQRAIKYNIEFTITVDDIIVPDTCPILEIPLVLGTKGNYQASPSIDRIDPKGGYIPNNIRVISTMANTMKNSANYEQLIKFCTNTPRYLQNMI